MSVTKHWYEVSKLTNNNVGIEVISIVKKSMLDDVFTGLLSRLPAENIVIWLMMGKMLSSKHADKSDIT